MKYLVFVCLVAIATSCATYTGNVSTGSSIDCPLAYFAQGEAFSVYYFGVGGLAKNTLIAEAKKNLYLNYPLAPGLKYSNFSVDFKNTYVLFYRQTLATVTAEVYNCNPAQANSNTSPVTTKPIERVSTTNGFRIGDTVLCAIQGLPRGVITKQIKEYINDHFVLVNITTGSTTQTKKIPHKEIFKVNPSPENRMQFGFDIGDVAYFKEADVYNLGTRTEKKCVILAVNNKKAYIEYTTKNGVKKNKFVRKARLTM
jgi:hypothetical protein